MHLRAGPGGLSISSVPLSAASRRAGPAAPTRPEVGAAAAVVADAHLELAVALLDA